MKVFSRKNLLLWITLSVLAGLLATAARGMPTEDFVITFLRGLSVGAVTFLVAAGFSIIFGLLDVLNLAHGTLFMIGAYIGWTVYVRPDTIVDLLTPLALILSGLALGGVWVVLARRAPAGRLGQVLPWVGVVAAGAFLFAILPRYPIATWDLSNYAQSPISYAFQVEQGQRTLPPAATFDQIPPVVALGGLLIASLLGAFSLSLLGGRAAGPATRLTWRDFVPFGLLLALGLGAFAFGERLTQLLNGLDSNWLFLLAVLVAVLSGAGLGGMMESTLIRPLYSRPIYQLMLTLGLSAIGIEMVRAIWGRPEFTMPKPELFSGTGEGCPAESLSALWQNHCSTIFLLDGRVRSYNEIFLPVVGIVVLVGVWILLRRTRLGMIIRAGVQDREMVEALGINVRRVFTLVFGLGVGLAALGGVLAAPSMGLSSAMGENLLLNALIALAIGGLTSFPGAALGSVIVGLLQQFMIKYGQIGISIPFTEIIFKPTPPIVPASTVLLMVIILLILPHGLLGKKEE